MDDKYILYEYLGTRYIIPSYTSKVKAFFEECKKEYETSGKKIEVDIKHCKFNPDNYNLVTLYCNEIKFTDTSNSVIDSMLIHNEHVMTERKKMESDKSIIMNIPADFAASAIMQYIRDVDNTKIYRLMSPGELNGKEPSISVMVAMAITCLRPDVLVDISAQPSEYFRRFQKYWTYTGLVSREAYNVLWNGNILKVTATNKDADGNNIFYIPGAGTISEEGLNHRFTVIPFEFGNAKPKEILEDKELNVVYDNICKDLQETLNKKRLRKKKLQSKLETIQGG